MPPLLLIICRPLALLIPCSASDSDTTDEILHVSAQPEGCTGMYQLIESRDFAWRLAEAQCHLGLQARAVAGHRNCRAVLRICLLCPSQCFSSAEIPFHPQAALEAAKDMRLCRPGDCVVALHRIGNASGEWRTRPSLLSFLNLIAW